MADLIRVDSKDPDLGCVALDTNGNGIYHYMGQPFTGIKVVYTKDGILWGEFEYKEGHQWGAQREYYSNGQIESEFNIGPGGLYGRWCEWDENGNLIDDKMWIDGEEQL